MKMIWGLLVYCSMGRVWDIDLEADDEFGIGDVVHVCTESEIDIREAE